MNSYAICFNSVEMNMDICWKRNLQKSYNFRPDDMCACKDIQHQTKGKKYQKALITHYNTFLWVYNTTHPVILSNFFCFVWTLFEKMFASKCRYGSNPNYKAICKNNRPIWKKFEIPVNFYWSLVTNQAHEKRERETFNSERLLYISNILFSII